MAMRYPGGLIATSPVNAAYPSGVWTQSQTIPYASQNVWQRDQYWRNTTLLLHGDGTNGAQNNTFLDSSSNNFSITRNGNTTQGAFTPYQQNGYWSNYFDGSSAALTTPSNSALSFGTGDFTAECFVFCPSYPGSAVYGVIDISTSNTTGRFVIDINTSGNVMVETAGVTIITASTTLPKNTWTHIAAVRSGTTLSLFQNGSRVGTATNSTNFSLSTANIAKTSDNYYFPGYISNVRLVKGTAVYDPTQTSLTVPTGPLTAITNTSLLTCQSNRFVDNSSNSFAITVNGTPSVQAFQPFPGPTTWSASVLGGSGYFDGSGDYLITGTSSNLTLANNADWTVEAWIFLSASTYQQILFNSGGGSDSWSTQHNCDFAVNSSGFLSFEYSASGTPTSVAGTTATTRNAWNHIAWVFNGTSKTLTTYVNGVRDLNATSVSGYTPPNATPRITIGRTDPTVPNPYEWWVTGYISNVRVVRGSQVYSGATITVPTSPLTAITNTSLLLNMTNAGIFDNAQMNDLETVGNAQVSTSVVKYGTGSMYFDGSGDALAGKTNPAFAFGTGDFTIEAWINVISYSGTCAIFDSRTAGNESTGIIFYITAAGKLEIYNNATLATSSGAITTNAWVHAAVTRNNSTVTFWINGVSSGTATVSTNFTQQNCYVGAAYNASSNPFNGYIDDLRITKGVARYISTFTPPIARMPNQ